jgi:hypothetical protein
MIYGLNFLVATYDRMRRRRSKCYKMDDELFLFLQNVLNREPNLCKWASDHNVKNDTFSMDQQ